MQGNLVIIGFTSCGKSTIGRHLAKRLNKRFIDLDRRIEGLYADAHDGLRKRCRAIFQEDGPEAFRDWERRAIESVRDEANMILATGGGAPLREENRPLLKALGPVLYLKAFPPTLFGRMERKGLPGYLASNPTVEGLAEVWEQRHPIYQSLADLSVETDSLTVGNAVGIVERNLKRLERKLIAETEAQAAASAPRAD